MHCTHDEDEVNTFDHVTCAPLPLQTLIIIPPPSQSHPFRLTITLPHAARPPSNHPGSAHTSLLILPCLPSFLRLLPLLPPDRHLSSNSQDLPLVAPSHHARIAQIRLAIHTASRRQQPHKARAAHSPRWWARFGIPSPIWKCLWITFVRFLIPFRLGLLPATWLLLVTPSRSLSSTLQ